MKLQEDKKKIKRKSKFEPGNYKLKVKKSVAGLGLYTESEIEKGKCIIEYWGRTITPAEEYTINSKYLFEIHSRRTIDGSARANIARYINHSCRSNAEPEIRKGRVFIMAKRAIKQGEEITYDYGKEYWNEYIKPFGCRCEKCRK